MAQSAQPDLYGNWPTYLLRLILTNFWSQKFWKQIYRALQIVESDGTFWISKTKNVYPFSYLLYKSKVFAFIIRMSQWRRGRMLGSHAKGLWIKSRPGKFFICLWWNIISAQISYFHIQISVINIISYWYKRENKRFGKKNFTTT